MDRSLKMFAAEFLGTFTLCFIGQGAICAHFLMDQAQSGLLGVAVAHGLALAVMISALAATSGAHFNPAVTLGFLLTGRQSIGLAIGYWIAQLAGAVVASFLISMVVPATGEAARLGALSLGHGTLPSGAVIIELVCTFLLAMAVWGTAVDPRRHEIGGIGIGLMVLVCILFAGPLTGAALNPARAFGAAFVIGDWQHQWVWWVGPLLGGALGAFAYRGLFLEEKTR